MIVMNPRCEIFLRVLRIQRLHSDAELRLIHRVYQIAQDLFRSAAGEGFDEKEDGCHGCLLSIACSYNAHSRFPNMCESIRIFYSIRYCFLSALPMLTAFL